MEDLKKLEIRKTTEKGEGNVGIAYFKTKDQATGQLKH